MSRRLNGSSARGPRSMVPRWSCEAEDIMPMQILSVPNKMRNSSSFTSIHWKASPHSALRVFIISISIQDRRPRDHMMMLVPLRDGLLSVSPQLSPFMFAAPLGPQLQDGGLPFFRALRDTTLDCDGLVLLRPSTVTDWCC